MFLEARYSKLDSQSSILENFEARVEFWDVRGRSRIYQVEFRDFRVGKTKGLFVRLTFDTSEYFFTGRSILISGP